MKSNHHILAVTGLPITFKKLNPKQPPSKKIVIIDNNPVIVQLFICSSCRFTVYG